MALGTGWSREQQVHQLRQVSGTCLVIRYWTKIKKELSKAPKFRKTLLHPIHDNERATLEINFSRVALLFVKKILFYYTNVLYNTQKDGIISM